MQNNETNRIINILMERDGLTKEEAKDLYKETQDMLNEAIENGDFMECDQIIADQLGLEPDYLMDIIGY